jgi:5-methylcytosine-specific restriction protein A
MPRPSSSQRGYDSAWLKARTSYLRSHPLCVMCANHGRVTKAEHVDHRTPHKGDTKRFWDKANWQPLCAEHHNAWKQRVERTGRNIGCDADGYPLP